MVMMRRCADAKESSVEQAVVDPNSRRLATGCRARSDKVHEAWMIARESVSGVEYWGTVVLRSWVLNANWMRSSHEVCFSFSSSSSCQCLPRQGFERSLTVGPTSRLEIMTRT